MNKLFIVIPAYNEQDTIKSVTKEWYGVIEKISEESRLVIVNDGSKDQTLAILHECKADMPQLVVIDKKNGGHGSALLKGYQYATEQKADYVFQTDSDGQTCAEEFWPFWEKREQYDMVIGNRNHREDGFFRVFVTKVLKIVVRMALGEWVVDANTPFRLMKPDKLKEILSVIPEDYNLPNIVISAGFQTMGWKVKYIPITFKPRQGGVNSINLKKIALIGLKAIQDFRVIRKKMKGKKQNEKNKY